MKLILHLATLAWKQATRHRIRSLLTVAGVGAGIFLYGVVETMQSSLRSVTETKSDDITLVVYRENRFCPATSRLPEHYLTDIRQVSGVIEAIPVQVAVNNCGASLDVIAFRGVPPAVLRAYNPDLEVIAGSIDAWEKRSDGALVGEHFAARRNLAVGDQFEAVGVRVYVAGIIRSVYAQDNNVAYVHLPFLQQATRLGLGVVTQFNVRVRSHEELKPVAAKIDALFQSDSSPTTTRPEKAFFAQTARDMIEMIAFTRWLGLGAILAVLGLMANSLLLAARGRVMESAILQTLGYPRLAVGMLMIWEGGFLGLAGGAAGSALAALFFHFQRYTFGSEGLTMALSPSLAVTLNGLAIAVVLGLIASIWPALTASSQPIVTSLRQA